MGRLAAMKFIVDLPLGGLAKWLRFCGFDALYQNLSGSDPGRLPPPTPGTYLLTSQGAMQRLKRADLLIINAAPSVEQLKEVLGRLKISRRQISPLSRCGQCNDLLLPVSRDLVQGRVPDHVFHHQADFYECPRCHRLYWPGSHLLPLTARLNQALGRRRLGQSVGRAHKSTRARPGRERSPGRGRQAG